MRKTLVIAALAAAGFLVAGAPEARGQSLDRKVEVGALASVVTATNGSGTGAGGGRLAYNFTDHVALDTEVNVYPDGPSVQGLFGVKAGGRSDRFGVFAKVRPGFITADAEYFDPQLDVGGVVEFYPTKATILRFDVGDTMSFAGAGTRHFLQASVGFGWRF